LTYTDKKQTTEEGYKTLKLSNVFRDPSFVREALSYEIARDYMPASKCNFIKLYINDKYWGIYNSSQSVDGKFLREYYGDNDGTFFKCDPPNWKSKEKLNCEASDKASLQYVGDNLLCYNKFYELKSDTIIGWKDLIELTEALNNDDDELESLLDIDQTLWMLAFNNVLVNLDSYTGRLCHNYYLYKNDSGQFHPIIWDLNMSLGGFRFLGEGKQLVDKDLQKMSPFVHYKNQNEKRPLVSHLLKNELYRKIYIAHIKSILEDHFTNGQYLKRAKEIQNQISEFVETDENRLYPYEDFQKNLDTTIVIGKSTKIIGITQLMDARAEYLSNHPLLKKPAPSFIHSTYETQDSLVEISTTTSVAKQTWLFYRKDKTDFFHRVAMEKTGEQENNGISEHNWSQKIPYSAGMQYYLVAEGERAAALSPAKAAKEFHQIDEPINDDKKAE